MTLYLMRLRAGRCFRGRTRSPNATFSNDGHMAKQGVMLKDEADLAAGGVAARHVLVLEEDRPAARIGLLQAGDDPQQGGLARAGRPQQGHQLAAGDREAHVAQGGEIAEGLADSLDFDAHGRFPRS